MRKNYGLTHYDAANIAQRITDDSINKLKSSLPSKRDIDKVKGEITESIKDIVSSHVTVQVNKKKYESDQKELSELRSENEGLRKGIKIYGKPVINLSAEFVLNVADHLVSSRYYDPNKRRDLYNMNSIQKVIDNNISFLLNQEWSYITEEEASKIISSEIDDFCAQKKEEISKEYDRIFAKKLEEATKQNDLLSLKEENYILKNKIGKLERLLVESDNKSKALYAKIEILEFTNIDLSKQASILRKQVADESKKNHDLINRGLLSRIFNAKK